MCSEGAGCLDGSVCAEGGCTVAVEGLLVDCEGPHRAGGPPTRCGAALQFAAAYYDVTDSPFLRWSQGTCTGPTCTPANGPDAPSIETGGALRARAGTFQPAGSVDATRVTSDVVLEVRARFQLGTTEVEGTVLVSTLPVP